MERKLRDAGLLAFASLVSKASLENLQQNSETLGQCYRRTKSLLEEMGVDGSMKTFA